MGRVYVADALRKAGARVEVLTDHFPEDARDEHWLRKAGAENWIVLTKDKRIRHRSNEFAAVRRFKARVFVLTSKDLRGPETAQLLCGALDKLVLFASSNPAPFIAGINKAGDISLLAKSGTARPRGSRREVE